MPGKKSLSPVSITQKLWLIMMLLSATRSCIVIISGLSQRTQEIETTDNNAILPAQSLEARQKQFVIGTRLMLSTLALLPEVRKLDSEVCSG
jgi:Tfp pilus assembly protein PilN